MLITEDKQQFINRSRMDIMASLLTRSIDGARKTKLLYGCNLSTVQCNKYIDYLVDVGFLQRNINGNKGRYYETYQATQKGIEFINDYRRLMKSCKILKET